MTPTTEQKRPSYLHIEGDIPADLDDGTFISLTRKRPLKIYSLGFQPARSIPEIARWFLHKYASLPFTVLEPFAGAGTTIIEGLKYGASVYWLDYHPLSRLICRVKTTQFSPAEVLEESSNILRAAASQKSAPETVNFVNKDFWFQKPVQEGLETLREHILKSKATTRPMLWLALASTVRKTSNSNDGMLLAARRSHIEKIPKRSRSDVFRYFQLYVDGAVAAIVEWNHFMSGSIKNAKELPLQDARTLEGDWTCDAVITSPPYINAMDYVWASKFELHWLGMVQSDEDRLNLYSREIGTERIPREECKQLGRTGNRRLDRLIEDVYTGRKYKASRGQNELRARVVHKYFTDMREHL
ncbi:MAG: DNA methylase, partial [Anaerolineae bacterium]|nr:DNA methylase [Anaerolineae bacterium]